MSETVHYTGKLKPIYRLPNETFEDLCKRILKENGYTKLSTWFSTYEEMLSDELYGEYVIVNKNLYQIIEKHNKDTEFDIFNAHLNKDGTIDYEIMYYNGGCSFQEAIEYSLENMEDELER